MLMAVVASADAIDRQKVLRLSWLLAWSGGGWCPKCIATGLIVQQLDRSRLYIVKRYFETIVPPGQG